MRHGESTANVEAICAGGQTSHPLTPLGRVQARTAAQTLHGLGIKPDRIIHSGQPRALETAQIVGDTLAVMSSCIEGDTNWRERSFGEWEGVPFADVYPHLLAWVDPPGGETLPVLYNRISSALAALEGGTNLVVSHGGLWHVLHHLHGVAKAVHIGNADILAVTINPRTKPSIGANRIV